MSKSKSTKVIWNIEESIYILETVYSNYQFRFRRLFTDRDMMERFGLYIIGPFTTGYRKDLDYGVWIRLNEGKYTDKMNILQMDPITNQVITVAPAEEYKAKFEKTLFMRYIENKT